MEGLIVKLGRDSFKINHVDTVLIDETGDDIPMVSVTMITYNHQLYIAQAIEGVMEQKTNFKFVLVIGEDFGTDKTREIILEYQQKYPQKIILKLPKSNLGMMENSISNKMFCNGKYIAECEGDDYWTDPFKLQKQVDFLESNSEYSGCFHNTMIIDETAIDKKLKPWKVYEKSIFSLKDVISKYSLFHTSSFVFRKELLTIPNWHLKVVSGDLALFSNIASQGPLYRIDEYMSVYRKNEGGITNAINIKNFHKGRIKLLKFYKQTFDKSVFCKIDEVTKFHKEELFKLKVTAFKNLLKKALRK